MSREKKMLQRLRSEIDEAKKSEVFRLAYDENNLQKMYFIFTVTNTDSDYYGQEHVVEAVFSAGKDGHYYPTVPPACRFLTPMWHVNVSEDGHICLDTLKNQWSAMFWFETIVMSILQLLDDPYPDSALNTSAKYNVNERESFRKIVSRYYESKKDDKIDAIKHLINY